MTEAPFNIVSLFIRAAAQRPEAIALMAEGQSVSYAKLLAEVKLTAALYQRKGLGKGDAVLVFVPMGIDLYRIVLALFHIGAVPVFLDEWVSRKRLALCCAVVPCRGFIASRKLLLASFLLPALRKIPVKIAAGARGHAAIEDAPAATMPGDTALVTFTTGTTGRPKAADRTHAFLRAQLEALEPLLDRDHQTALTLLPIVVLANLGLGRTTLLPPRGFKIKDPATTALLVKLLAAQAPQAIIASPSVLIGMALELEKGRGDFIQQVITGGGAVFPDGALKISEAFPLAEKTVVYGSTEAEPVSRIGMDALALVPAAVIARKGLPVGRPELELAIIPISENPLPAMSEAAWTDLLLKEGEAGEIVVTGAHVLTAYLNNPEGVNRQKIRVGGKTWHRTGDAGRLDENGTLYLLGRCSEVIERKEGPIYPLIHAYLLGLLIGRDAAIVQLPSRVYVVIEGAPINSAAVAPALQGLGLDGAALRFVPALPRDPRHRTRIDGEKLLAWLQKRS